MTVWLRSWKYKTGKKRRRVHVEVRDPDLNLYLVKVYRGKDHTFHIILEEGEKNGPATRPQNG